MNDYMERAAKKAEILMRDKWKAAFERINYLLSLWKPDNQNSEESDGKGKDLMEDEKEELYDNDDKEGYAGLMFGTVQETIAAVSNTARIIMYRQLQTFAKRFDEYARRLIAIGFNFSGYDIILILKEFVAFFGLTNQSTKVIKQANRYVSILTPSFHFVNICLYLSPHTSYASFLRAFQVDGRKSFFPYEFLNDVSKFFFPNFYWSLKKRLSTHTLFTLLDNEQISKNDTHHITDRRRNMQ